MLVKKLPLEVHLETPTGVTLPPSDHHEVCRVNLRESGEIWGIDPTGIQHGYREPLIPWHEVEASDGRHWDIFRSSGFGIVMDKIFTALPLDPLRAHAASRLEKIALGREIAESFPALKREFGDDKDRLGGVLKGSDEKFSEVKGKFLARMEEVVKEAMDKIYTMENFRERKKTYKRFLNSGIFDRGSVERAGMEELEDRMAEDIAWRGIF